MIHGKNHSKTPTVAKVAPGKTTSENVKVTSAKLTAGNFSLTAYLPGKATTIHGKASSKASSVNKKISHKVLSDAKVSPKHSVPSKSSSLLSPKKIPLVPLVHGHSVPGSSSGESVRTASIKKSAVVNSSHPKVSTKVSSVGKAVSLKSSKSKTSKASSSKVVGSHSVDGMEAATATALAEMGRF